MTRLKRLLLGLTMAALLPLSIAHADPSAMAKVNSDPNYQKQVPNRDRIHKMDLVTLFFADQAER